MVQKLSIKQYRKLKDINFTFTPGINIISGTNGTCKTSLLHIISNSFQAVNRQCSWVNDPTSLEVIRKINNITNAKVENLTRGDSKYNDPAFGHKGVLYSVEYSDSQETIDFRRHNSKASNRYAIKPFYKSGTTTKLPFLPAIYLGLSRLVPFGEFQNDDAVENIKKTLPVEYQNEVARIYESFTGLTISVVAPQKMGDIKIRSEFISSLEGIDSNTISAGEDNLFIIITALVSLKYFYESINSKNTIESVFLIDEFDATLHPSLQIRLLKLFAEYSLKYRIQIFFTTHSLSLLEEALNKHHNVIYLIDNVTNIVMMNDVDIYKIKMHLHSITKDDIYLNKAIPIFTEDAEARLFLRILFDYYIEKFSSEFLKVSTLFHFVDANIGATNLISIFKDNKLMKSTMRSICILDGDHGNEKNLSNCILVLPGGDSPENFIMKYGQELWDNDDPFWSEEIILQLNYGKIYFRDNIKMDIVGIEEKIEQARKENKSTKGVRREESKKVFIKHQRFFELLFKHWLNNDENQESVLKFYDDLYKLFKKVAEFHGINSKEWTR